MTAIAVRAHGSPSATARRVGFIALAASGACFGVVTTWLKASSGTHPWWDVLLSSTSAYLFLIAGVIARARQPESRIGVLMVIVGVTMFAEDLQLSADPAVHTVGMLLRAASAAPLAHLMLAFPSGRVQRRIDRVIVGAAYLWSYLVMPLAVPFQVSEVPNLLNVANAAGVTDAVGKLGLPLAAAAFAALLHRWWHERPQVRYVLTPVVLVNLAIAAATLGAALFWGSQLGLYRPFIVSYQIAACLLPLAFLLGVLRIRLGRSALSRLVQDLSRQPSGAELQRLLRRTLGDPALEVGYRRSAGSDYVTLDGAALEAVPVLGRVVTPVRHDGRVVGALLHDRALLDDPHQLGAVAAAAGMALENQRLNAELAAQLAEVRRSRARIAAAAQTERARVERDLHDGVQAKLVAALIAVRQAEAAGSGGQPELLERSGAGLAEALADLRRITHGIRPALLAEAGLVDAVADLLDRAPLQTGLDVDSLEVADLDPGLENCIYFVVAETLANTLKHACARHFDVRLAGSGPVLQIRVTDDGSGGAALRDGGGLQGLDDRVQALGGTLRLESDRARGTVVAVQFGGPAT